MHYDYNGNSHLSEFERDEANRRIAAQNPYGAASGPAAVSIVMIALIAVFSLFALLFFATKAFLTRGAPKLWPGSFARALKLFLLYEVILYAFDFASTYWYFFIQSMAAQLSVPHLLSWFTSAEFWLYQVIYTQLLYTINMDELAIHYLARLCLNTLSIVVWLLVAKTLATYLPHLTWFRFRDATGQRIDWLRVIKVHLLTSLLFWSVVFFFN